ncbi:unnamed protein product [Rotaria sordida]|uniref:Uncharacterized protein n=2 Tax=Rotaria sordida TaxID=392033 RepID=A0A819C1F8_9BILA|nr:unnamed protein product [Rotaria sordida]
MADDGAKMVRIYGPICEQQMVWDNIVQAAAENNLYDYCSGVLGIVWHGYSDAELIMPYYGTCDMPGAVWGVIEREIEAFKRMIPNKQIMITQNPWGSSKNGRNRGSNCGSDVWKGVSLEGANEYWRLWTSRCQYFKQQQIGWFAHTFSVCS